MKTWIVQLKITDDGNDNMQYLKEEELRKIIDQTDFGCSGLELEIVQLEELP